MNRNQTPTRSPLRIARVLFQWGLLTRDLARLDKVFALQDELTQLRSAEEEAAVLGDFARTPVGRAALVQRHRLGRLKMEEMLALGQSTLGGAYARFLQQRGLSPESIPNRQVLNDIDYVIAHFYETHDLWHVLTGFETDPAGEAGVQAFLLAQSRSYLPLLVLSSILLNTVLYSYEDRTARLDAITRGWLLGRRSKSFVGVDWRPYLVRSLDDVRAEFGMTGGEAHS